MKPLSNLTPEGELCLEYWGPEKRKLTLYCEPHRVHAIKTWGPDIDFQMEDVWVDKDKNSFQNLMLWLETGRSV